MFLAIQLEWWQLVLILVIVILGAAVATFFITRKLFAKELKKNPPVNEAMIRAMMTQMGRTPSEKQVRAVMRSMEDAKNN
ncbi:MAG: YneF family protein [Erysipelotrichaceae bacterium]|nr:YneF family protein [Erysipelotrichaceae bacterium]